jgi:hypothetical protein
MIPARRDCIMPIQWKKDIETAVAEARSAGRHTLVDFSAAPQ